MSYRDLIWSGQLWAAEKMLEPNSEDRPERAEYRHAMVIIFRNLKLKFFIEMAIVDLGGLHRAIPWMGQRA